MSAVLLRSAPPDRADLGRTTRDPTVALDDASTWLSSSGAAGARLTLLAFDRSIRRSHSTDGLRRHRLRDHLLAPARDHVAGQRAADRQRDRLHSSSPAPSTGTGGASTARGSSLQTSVVVVLSSTSIRFRGTPSSRPSNWLSSFSSWCWAPPVRSRSLLVEAHVRRARARHRNHAAGALGVLLRLRILSIAVSFLGHVRGMPGRRRRERALR